MISLEISNNQMIYNTVAYTCALTQQIIPQEITTFIHLDKFKCTTQSFISVLFINKFINLRRIWIHQLIRSG